jgi:hypothetical protein
MIIAKTSISISIYNNILVSLTIKYYLAIQKQMLNLKEYL